jgi:hypothetical protein
MNSFIQIIYIQGLIRGIEMISLEPSLNHIFYVAYLANSCFSSLGFEIYSVIFMSKINFFNKLI